MAQIDSNMARDINKQINSQSALIKMAISMIIFGTVGFFSKRTGLPALELVFIRCVAATLFLSVMWGISGGIKEERWDASELKRIILCSLFLILNWVYFFKTIEVSGVTIAISIYHLAPVIVLLGGALLYREPLKAPALLAVATCFIGILLIAEIHKIGTSSTPLINRGLLWGLLSALFYALLTLTGKGLVKMSAYAITLIQVSLGILMLLPFIDLSHFYGLSSTQWLYILLTGFLHTGVVFYLFFDSIRKLSTGVISLLVFLDPLVAIFIDLFVDNITIAPLQWVGVAAIFMGMAFTLIPQKRE